MNGFICQVVAVFSQQSLNVREAWRDGEGRGGGEGQQKEWKGSDWGRDEWKEGCSGGKE